MPSGLIINSPYRHLGVKKHGETEEQDKPGSHSKKRKQETNDRDSESNPRKMVRKDRKICRGKFFIRRKNNQRDDRPRDERAASDQRRSGSHRDERAASDQRRSGFRRDERAASDQRRSRSYRQDREHNGPPRRGREKWENDPIPVSERGVPYHLRKNRKPAEKAPAEEIRASQ
ncbi:hypothetical protein ACFLU6_01360 [Acidobacteriota bacterium]